jgi:single-strand DNA-binding protein
MNKNVGVFGQGREYPMARDYNKVVITGRLGTDPEMRFIPSGIPVTTFRVAVNRTVGRSETGDRRDETDWFTVKAWRQLAEFCNQYLTKGKRVLVEGRLETRSWDGPDGQKRYATDIVASEVHFMDSAPQPAGAGARGGAAGDMNDDLMEPDDLPF